MAPASRRSRPTCKWSATMADRRGRPAKTAEARIVEGGSPGQGAISHRPLARPVVLAPRITAQSRPECPEGLPAEGRDLWEASVEFLIDINAAQVIDVPALRVMCIHYAMASQASDVLAEQGFFSRGSTGQMVEHPAVRIFERQSARFLAYATEFGLTTLARTRLGLLDVTRRTMESDLNNGLGRNPRRTHRAPAA
jgi:P27 family predicted phage terminase small subunit